MSTRRGKQFNSMVQKSTDPLTGAARDAILMNGEDADGLALPDGAAVRLRSPHGTFDGRVQRAAMRSGNMAVHWPEGNVLLGPAVDPDSMEPDYNAVVTLEALGGRDAAMR